MGSIQDKEGLMHLKNSVLVGGFSIAWCECIEDWCWKHSHSMRVLWKLESLHTKFIDKIVNFFFFFFVMMLYIFIKNAYILNIPKWQMCESEALQITHFEGTPFLLQQLIWNRKRKSVLSALWEFASRALNKNRALVEASISSPGNLTILSCYATCSANALFPHGFSQWEMWTFFPSQPNCCISKLGVEEGGGNQAKWHFF